MRPSPLTMEAPWPVGSGRLVMGRASDRSRDRETFCPIIANPPFSLPPQSRATVAAETHLVGAAHMVTKLLPKETVTMYHPCPPSTPEKGVRLTVKSNG